MAPRRLTRCRSTRESPRDVLKQNKKKEKEKHLHHDEVDGIERLEEHLDVVAVAKDQESQDHEVDRDNESQHDHNKSETSET